MRRPADRIIRDFPRKYPDAPLRRVNGGRSRRFVYRKSLQPRGGARRPRALRIHDEFVVGIAVDCGGDIK